MTNVTDYFATEHYRKCLLLLILSGVPILTAVAFASTYWRISPPALATGLFSFVACNASAVFIIMRGARARAKASSSSSAGPLDDASRRKLRGMIHRLQFYVAFFALALVFGLWETRGDWSLLTLVGVGISLLIQFALIHSIRKMQRLMKWGISSICCETEPS
jgi:hypothetical protein